MQELESPRLRFRRIEADDLDALAALYADPDVMHYYPRTRSKAETREAILNYQKKYATHECTVMATILKEENRFIGRCGLTLQSIEEEIFPEVGYMLDKKFWRGGLGTEAAVTFRDYAFKSFDFPELISIIHPLNLGSQGVARKIGMTFQRTAIYDNVECRIYSITRDNWNALQTLPSDDGFTNTKPATNE